MNTSPTSIATAAALAAAMICTAAPALAQPVNDACDNATVVDLANLPYTDIQDTSTANNEGDPAGSCDPIPLTMTTDNSIWYTFTAAQDTPLRITVDPDIGAGYDGIVTVFTDGCLRLTEVACAQDPEPIVIDLTALAGVPYLVCIGDTGTIDGGGLTQFDVDLNLPTGACCTGPSCTVLTRADCDAAGGTYLGDGTDCSTRTPYEHTALDLPIPDADTTSACVPGVVSDTITIPDDAAVTDLKVRLDIDHPFVGNLKIALTGPGGSSVELLSMPRNTTGCNCGELGDNDHLLGVYTFTDDAPTTVTQAVAPTSVAYLPPGDYHPGKCVDQSTSLDAMFAGASAQGDWTLTISDNRPLFTGVLRGWGLIVNGGEAPCAGATCPCETDGDSAQVNVFDLLTYLSDWFGQNGTTGAGLSADFNNSGNVDVFDLLDFLSCWFPASAGNACP